MASIFLSYAREDAAKASALTDALHNATHTVWWDRHIRSGSEFAGAIEKALNESDAVVVLWSRSSIGSQWVRDEAAEGRDSGRLIPVLLDDSRPPMGFRQLQALDLSNWTGRGAPRQLGELLNAISEKAETSPAVHHAAVSAQTQVSFTPKFLGMIAAALIVLAGLAYLVATRSADSEPPTLAILPFADLSPQKDKGYFTEGLAEEILSLVAREPGIRVIGRSSSGLLQQGAADLPKMRKSLGVTHVLEGSARTVGEELRLSVRLVETATGTEVWAQDYQRQLSNVFVVQDEIGRAIADQLRGTLSRPRSKHKAEVTKPEIYTMYLQARSKMRDRKRGPIEEARRLATQVVAADPDYAPGHALLAELAFFSSADHYGTLAPTTAYRLARPHALRAIELAPNAPEGYAALGAIEQWEPSKAVGPLSHAVRLDPARAEVRLWLADAYSLLGRNMEALEHYRALEELEPLWQPSIALLTVSLVAAGEIDQARQIVDRFERRGGRAGEAAVLRGRFAEMSGDLSEAVKQVRLASRLDPQMTYAKMLLSWYYHMLGLQERAQATAAAEPLYTRLYLAGQQAALFDDLRKNALAWGQHDSDVAVAALSQARDWRALELLYDQWRRQPHEGCLVTYSGGVTAHRHASAMAPVNFAIALESRGRAHEASALLQCVKSSIARQSGGPIRHYSIGEPIAAFTQAQIFAIEGDRKKALQALGQAIDAGWRGWFTTNLSGYPALNSLQTSPEYRQLQGRLNRLIAADRAEVLSEAAAL